ncbi:hypothetical protein ccbrp13_43550 [Ktedonobacteria bacterium brp13]|nr:hypothetical protein ccbrp13_43550 [Ktedonobacteria bacterium brp13]
MHLSHWRTRALLFTLATLVLLIVGCGRETTKTTHTIHTTGSQPVRQSSTSSPGQRASRTGVITANVVFSIRAERQPLLVQIANALDTAHTLHGSFTTSISSPVFNGTVNSELWKMAPNQSRSEIHQSTLAQEQSGSVNVTNGKQLWQYNPTNNIVYTGQADTSSNGNTTNNGLNGIAGTGGGQLQTLFALVQGIFEQGQGTLKPGTSIINARHAVDIHVVSTSTAGSNPASGSPFSGNQAALSYNGEVYVDQQTHLPLKVNITIAGLGDVSMSFNSLEINPILPASTFTFATPAGASVQPLSAESNSTSGTVSSQLTLAQAEKQAGYHLLSIPGDQGQYQLNGVTLLGTRGNQTYELNYMKGNQSFTLAEGKPLANLPLDSAGQQVQIQGQSGMLSSSQGAVTVAWTQQGTGLRLIGPLSTDEEQAIANMLN